MKLTVNGKEMECKDGASVSGLLVALGLSDRRVAVELNRAIIHRDDYDGTGLKDGDVLEILSFVGGG
jgi:thiamine biosynthesis protein ThiS